MQANASAFRHPCTLLASCWLAWTTTTTLTDQQREGLMALFSMFNFMMKNEILYILRYNECITELIIFSLMADTVRCTIKSPGSGAFTHSRLKRTTVTLWTSKVRFCSAECLLLGVCHGLKKRGPMIPVNMGFCQVSLPHQHRSFCRINSAEG